VSLRLAPDEWSLYRYASIRRKYQASLDTAVARAQNPNGKSKNATR
jgi:hypothetical protein